MISLFLFNFDFFFQTFNGNFDQNSVQKQILFRAFVARYLRFVVGSTHGGACLRVEVSGIPRSRGLIFLIAEIASNLDLGGGCRGCAPPEMTCGFLIKTVRSLHS